MCCYIRRGRDLHDVGEEEVEEHEGCDNGCQCGEGQPHKEYHQRERIAAIKSMICTQQ